MINSSLRMEMEKDAVVFKESGKELFRVGIGQMADFVYLARVNFRLADLGLSSSVASYDTMYMVPQGIEQLQPSLRFVFKEVVAALFGRRTIGDEIHKGWRLDACDIPFGELAQGLEKDFALISEFSYMTPLPRGDVDYGDLLIRFKMAASGKGTVPKVDDLEQYRRANLFEYETLVAKKAVDFIEERGVYRVLHFKPEYAHTGLKGNKITSTVKTPITAAELKQLLGGDISVRPQNLPLNDGPVIP